MIQDNLTIRRKQLLFRACHRGMKEMDMILGSYAQNYITEMDDAQLNALEQLMSCEDRELYNCFLGSAPLPETVNQQLFKQILTFATRAR